MKVWASEVNVSVANLPGSLEYLVVMSAFFFFKTFFFFCDSSIWTFFVLDIAWGIIKIDFMCGIAHFRVLSDISYFIKGILKVFCRVCVM